MKTGAEQRLEILRRAVDRHVAERMRAHGWEVNICSEAGDGDAHLVIRAQRGLHRRGIAVLYSSASSNSTYRLLERDNDVILAHGGLYQVESFARGIKKPIRALEDFSPLLMDWNEATSDGKFAPGAEEIPQVAAGAPSSDTTVLLSETPIEAVWLRIRQLQSVRLATKLVAERAQREGASLAAGVAETKAEGIAFALRNASDYYEAPQGRTVTQRILNLYYGTMAFVSAEMLATPIGPATLAQIEDSTKQGHGLYLVDASSGAVQDAVVGVIKSGFFSAWLKFLGRDTTWIPAEKARKAAAVAALPEGAWVTLESLFARVPEIADLFRDIFESPSQWVQASYDAQASTSLLPLSDAARPRRVYAQLTDFSGRLSREDIGRFPGPISQIRSIASTGKARSFQVAVDFQGLKTWWDALSLHSSPFVHAALIKPIFRDVVDFRILCFVLLYALSIIARYRPSIWRRIQEGDLDHLRILIEAFLTVAERVLPEQFLARVAERETLIKQPGTFF